METRRGLHLPRITVYTRWPIHREDKGKVRKSKSLNDRIENIMTITTKVQLLRSLVWPMISYGCESWTLKKSDESRINSFEMKAIMQLLRVSWTEQLGFAESKDET